MNHFHVFFKKELRESVRAHRLLIILTIFFMFGVMNPLTAKLTPDLLAKFLPEGMIIELPVPSSLDSWAQFFKNVTQMGLIVVLLVFSGILANEITQGTLINLLTKGLSREAVITAKYAAMLALWSMGVLVSSLVTWGYTVYLFPDGKSHNLVFAVFCLWLFGAFLLAQLVFSTTLVNSSYGSLIITGAVVVFLNILQIFPGVQPWNPLVLATHNMELIGQNLEPSFFARPIGLAFLGCCLLVVLAVVVFRKKQI
ncbi:MAG: ABC transporter permease [Limnochordia bacterium]